MTNPELWTELEYAAARRGRDELVRQRRWKEARSLLRAMSRAVLAELERASAPRQACKIVRSSSSVPLYLRHKSETLSAVA